MPRVSAYRLLSVERAYDREADGGVPFSDLVAKAGLPPDAISGPEARIELLHEAAVVEACCKALSDKTFAARVGLSAKAPGTLVAYLVRCSETLAEALELARRFYAMQDPDIRFELSQTPAGPRIALGSAVIPSHQYPRHRELLLFGLYQRVCQITDGGLSPIVVELETDDLEHCRKLSEIAGCPVEGARAGYALRFPQNAMNFHIPTADAALLAHLRQHGDAQLRAQPDAVQGLSERIVALLDDRLPGRVPNGDAIASEFGMTRRTLTRRLASEGTSYKALLEGVQCDLSRRLLRSGESIAQVAFMMDFADQAAFSVAFKRWTGETPARFRRQGR